MNEREKFLFDLQGFLVIKNVLTPEEVHKLNISVDKNLDKKVKRTETRPIPSGKISIFESFTYIILLCLLALIILVQFNLAKYNFCLF